MYIYFCLILLSIARVKFNKVFIKKINLNRMFGNYKFSKATDSTA